MSASETPAKKQRPAKASAKTAPARPIKDATLLTSIGRGGPDTCGTVNVPVHRASTIVSATLDEFLAKSETPGHRVVRYGALGTPSTFALEDAVAALEHGAGAAVTSSGLAACTQAILPFVSAGDHLLVTDSVYAPTRMFCDGILKRFGIETTYYDPLLPVPKLEKLIKANTRLIFTEAPGSLTFEMQDIPAIATLAKKHGCLTLIDNTWASPLYFKPLEHGVDISIQAATKYIAGHSDLVLGVISARTPELYARLKDCLNGMGEIASPDDCYLALRGLRSMEARMRVQQESALRVAKWLEARSEVIRVLYPPLASDPGHKLWKRDFTGAGALMGVVLPPQPKKALAAMLDGYRYFRIGASWGGFDSLVMPSRPGAIRTATKWDEKKQTLLRFSIGLEDADDLLEDLENGFERLHKAKK